MFEMLQQFLSVNMLCCCLAQVLIGSNWDIDGSKQRVVSSSRGQALAGELGIPFMEVNAKNNTNISEVDP